jgi:hypothetical protein
MFALMIDFKVVYDDAMILYDYYSDMLNMFMIVKCN